MSIETFYKTGNSKGEYSCGDIGISKEEWFQLLKHPDARPYFDTLCYFLREYNHAATCTAVAKKNGKTYEHYNAKVFNFARWVQKKLNRFQVLDTDGKETFWCIPMQKGWDTDEGFKWQLRDELVEALQYYLMKALIIRYRESEQLRNFDESYKWELLDITEGNGVLDIIKSLQMKIQGQQVNLVYNAQFNSVMNYLSKNKPNELVAIGDNLFDESKPIDDRIASFKSEMRSICPSDWKNYANDERTASALLMCKYPEKYTTYKDEVYQTVCLYFGLNGREVGKKFSHFMEIIDGFVTDFGEKVQGIMMPYINQYRNKPMNLAIQTVFWCMKEYMKDKIKPNKEPMPLPKKYKKYIELLKETHNLVLTGAPGTGKTHMAQAIAEEMGAVTKFVQFHPSYDYTDFVEGLRPVNKGDDQMGFKRRDGVFKKFCREAIEASTGETEDSYKVALQLFKNDLREQGEIEIPSYLSANSVPRTVYLSENDTVSVKVETAFSTSDERILNYMRSRDREVLGNDTYTYSIGEHIIREYKPKTHTNNIDARPFVFIIDEINRGEASKIFGELFFAIDPGYRGKTDHLVQTQYQNMVPETDVFAKGFYVPENVYILATMNDIDRSVESMDFAMRRRFTWHEITPDDTESMLDTLPCADEAKERMHRLNHAIAETDGLGAAYMIGPAYFLKLDKNGGDFEKLWKMNIQPLLKEYLRGFRKTDELLDKFSKAYFGKNETTSGNPLLEDEN